MKKILFGKLATWIFAPILIVAALAYADSTMTVPSESGADHVVLQAEKTIVIDALTSITDSVAGAGQIKLTDGVLAPVTDNDVDLGTSTIEFKDLFLDGTLTTDAIVNSGANSQTGDTNFASGGTVAIQEATAGTACSGSATATGATAVVISTTCATAGSQVILSRSSAPSGTAICWWDTLVAGVSFNLDCTAAETGTFDWLIVHETP